MLDKAIKVSTANTAPGALLWRSQTFTSTFQCTDDWNNPKGENAYLYWDPQSQMSKIHNSIEVGVTYEGLMSNQLKVRVRTWAPARNVATIGGATAACLRPDR